MRTYIIYYSDKDEPFYSISFCAETEDEALKLFYEWCDEEGFDHSYDKIEECYDPLDAEIYGTEYLSA